jgi:hypothetical protein
MKDQPMVVERYSFGKLFSFLGKWISSFLKKWNKEEVIYHFFQFLSTFCLFFKRKQMDTYEIVLRKLFEFQDLGEREMDCSSLARELQTTKRL